MSWGHALNFVVCFDERREVRDRAAMMAATPMTSNRQRNYEVLNQPPKGPRKGR